MVTAPWLGKIFRICPAWLMRSISGVNGHLKGQMSQSKSYRGHGVAHEVHHNAPKCTKLHQNCFHSMTELCVLNLSWVTNVIYFWIKKTHRKRIWVRASQRVAEQVKGSHMRSTKMYQNGHHGMTEQRILNSSWVTNIIHFWMKWTSGQVYKSEQIVEGSWGSAWAAPKCTMYFIQRTFSVTVSCFGEPHVHISHWGQIQNFFFRLA